MMIKMILALGLMATAATPTLVSAQPYDRDQGRYCDEQGRCSDQAPDARGDTRDSSYDDQYSHPDYRADPDQYRDYRSDRDQYTGRVGSRWVDANGRRCAWREVGFRDDDGYQAFKWVPVCRD